MDTVFVSSTCHDLIDIRGEVEEHLRAMGLRSRLSDSVTSDFLVDPSKDSIEVCLQNVRESDVVLVILSQRYGPSLGRYGYEDVSATHLEYREARKHRKPIFMYVRDRLAGEHAVWHRSGQKDDLATYPFGGKDALRLFSFIEEHKPLQSGGDPNWFWTFKNSLDLKQLVSKDLRVQSNRAVLRRLIDDGRVPVLTFGASHANMVWPSAELGLRMYLRNDQPLLQCETSTDAGENAAWKFQGDLMPTTSNTSVLALSHYPTEVSRPTTFRIRYFTMAGHHLEETVEVWVEAVGQPARCRHARRRLLDTPMYELG